jgi:hypothetical protein
MSRPKPHTYLRDFPAVPRAPQRAIERESAARRGRPRADRERVAIALRIDGGLLDVIREMAKQRGLAYQTYIHRLLARGVAQEAIVEAELKSHVARDE